MTDSTVLVDQPRPGVTRLTLNRPSRLNAMTAELVGALHDTLDTIAVDSACRVVVLTGAGRGFCAGLDLTGYGSAPDTDGFGRTQKGFAVQRHIARLIPHLRSLPQPVIAAINGPAAGGGFALVLGSDVRIAARSARFNAAFIRIGLSACDIGTSWLLPRLVGAARAHELMLTGRIFDAGEAERIGLVSLCVPRAELLGRAFEVAEKLARGSQQAIRFTKRSLNGWYDMARPIFESSLAMEMLCFLGEDAAEGVAAVREKRAPDLPSARAPGA